MFITFFFFNETMGKKKGTIWIMNNLKEERKRRRRRGKQCQPTKQEKEKEIKNMKRKKW